MLSFVSFVQELRRTQVLLVILRRPHQHTDGRRGLVVCRGVPVKRVCAVHPEQRRDARRPDVEDPGVCYFTVDLHHHLEILVPYDAVCNGKKGRGRSWDRDLQIELARLNLSLLNWRGCSETVGKMCVCGGVGDLSESGVEAGLHRWGVQRWVTHWISPSWR